MLETFSYVPTRESQKSMQPKVLVMSFGNGYKQIEPDGINNALETWSLTFTETESVAQIIDTFFTLKGGVTPFYWKSSGLGATTRTYLCSSWQTSPAGGCYWTITATFEEFLSPGDVYSLPMMPDVEMTDDLEMF